MSDERRRHPRRDLCVLVQLRQSAQALPQTVYALNVSESGLFVDVDDASFAVGDRVFVQVTTPDGNQIVKAEGRVARKADGGLGIALSGLDAAARETLLRLLGPEG